MRFAGSPTSARPRHVSTDEPISQTPHNNDNNDNNVLPQYNQSWFCLICRLLSGTGDYYDACACSMSRPYPNLKHQYSTMALLFAAQFFMFMGMTLSWATLFDCQLVHVNATQVDPFLASLYKNPPPLLSNRTTAALGFFFFQDLTDGSSCVLEDDINSTQTGDVGFIWIQSYIEFLGPAWYSFRRIQSGAQTLALVLCVWLGTYCCLSHTQRLRYLWCFINLMVLCPLQICSLAVLSTGFCQTHSCQIGRTYGFSMMSLLCFVVAAIIVLVKTRNYFPGMERIARPDKPIVEDRDIPERNNDILDINDDLLEHQETNVHQRNNDGLGDAVEVPISEDLIDCIFASPGDFRHDRNPHSLSIRKGATFGRAAVQF